MKITAFAAVLALVSTSAQAEWVNETIVSPIDDTASHLAHQSADGSGSPMPLGLIVSCVEGFYGITVPVRGYLGRADQPVEVAYRIGKEEAVYETWAIVPGGDAAAFQGSAEAIVGRLPDEGPFAVQVAGRNGSTGTVVLDMSGFAEARAILADNCNG